MSNILDRAARMLADNRKLRRWCVVAAAFAVVLVATVSALLVGRANALAGGDTLRNAITDDSALFWEPADGTEANWQPVDPNTPLDAAAKLRLRIAFELPAGTLSNGATLQYRLPEGLTLPNTADDQSDALAVYDAQTVGDPSEKNALRIGTATVRDSIVTVSTFDEAATSADDAATDASDSSTSQTDDQSAEASSGTQAVAGFVDFDFGFDALALDSDGYVKLALNDAQSLAVAKQVAPAPEAEAAEGSDATNDANPTTSATTDNFAPKKNESNAESADASSSAAGESASGGSAQAADGAATQPDTSKHEENKSVADPAASDDTPQNFAADVTATHVMSGSATAEVDAPNAAKPLRLHALLRPASTSPINFREYLTGDTTFQKLENGTWKNSTSFNDGDRVKIKLEYQLPNGTISTSKNTISYQLPDGVAPEKESSGDATDGNGNKIGTYSIDTSGNVTVVFDDAFASKGGVVQGKVAFTAKVSKTGSGTQGTIIFGGRATSITVTKPVEDKNDLYATKDGDLSSDRTKASYTVTVGTNNGTGNTVTIQDRIDNSSATNASPTYDTGSFKIYKVSASGAESPVSGFTPTMNSDQDGKGFSISGLPALSPGEKYKVTYDVKLNVQDKSKSVWVGNSAGGTSGNHSQYQWKSVGWNIEDEIQKTGTFDKDSGLISWRIKVNPNHKDVTSGDWVVYDELPKGCTLHGQYRVWGENGYSVYGGAWNDNTIRYEFPKSGLTDDQKTDTYYIDFWTTAPSGDTAVENTGKVWTGDGKYAESKVNVPVEHRKFDVVKTHTNESSFNKVYTETWKSEVTLPDTQLTNFTYTDTIKDAVDGDGNSLGAASHYATAGKLEEAFKQHLYVQVDDYAQYQYKGANEHTYYYYKDRTDLSGPTDDLTFTVTYYDANGKTVKPGDYKTPVKKFTVEVSVAKGHQIPARKLVLDGYNTYSDTSKAQEGSTWILKNEGSINGKTSEATQNIPIPKTFDKQVNTGSENVETRYKSGTAEVNYDKQAGTLEYRLMLNTTKDDEGTITVTDTLPKGEALVKNSVTARFFQNEYSSQQSNYAGTTFEDGKNPTYETKSNDDGTTTLTITIDNYKYVSGYPRVAVTYKVSVTKDEYWQDPKSTSKTYKNTATWKDHTSEQSTTVKRDVANVTKTGTQLDKDGKPLVLSNGQPTTSPSNKVRYYVDINPAGKDLNPGSQTLTLTDTMSDVDRYSPQLDLSSVRLYAYDVTADHHYKESGAISADRYSVRYDQATAKLVVSVPDGLPCVLVYDYQLDSDSVTSGSEVKNSCSLDGTWSSGSDLKLSEMESSAEATHKLIEMYKVDEDNYKKPLEGTFKLEKWDTSAGKWVVKNKSFTTNGGKFTWDLGVKKPPLDADALYRIIETKAPDGYALDASPHYFIWMGTHNNKDTAYNNSGAASAKKPDNSSGIPKGDISIFRNSGGSLYITNRYTRLSVKKVWAHEDGSSADAPSGANVTVQLKRSVRVTDPDQTCAVHIHAEGNGSWSATPIDLGTLNIKRGSSLKLKIAMWNGVNMRAVVNGVEYSTFTLTDQDYTLTIDADKLDGATADVDIQVTSAGNVPNGVTVLDYTKPPVKDSDVSVVDTVKLDSTNGWETYWENLPTKDDKGQTYSYVVKETASSVTTASTSYTNNDGIQTGAITVTNTLAEGYELPKTGGSGTAPLLACGSIATVLAALALLVRRRGVG